MMERAAKWERRPTADRQSERTWSDDPRVTGAPDAAIPRDGGSPSDAIVKE
jgi:hypothetical protein